MKLNEVETIVEQCIENYDRMQAVLAGPDERYKDPEEMKNVRKWQRENGMLLSHLDPLLNRFVERKITTRINGHEQEDVFDYCQQLNNGWGASMLGTAIQKLQALLTDLKRLAASKPEFDVMTLKPASRTDDCDALVSELIVVAKQLPETTYRGNLVASLEEMKACYAAGCYIATLFLAGKVLEFCLKIILATHSVQYDKQWGLGKLIGCVRDNCADIHLVDGLGNIASMINDNRNPAVHANERNPVPSREQATMVLNGLADVMKRTFI
jgi:hypothetical protein